ncbi:MAG: rubredoxin-like domain-containing protein [Candidatus Hodarchaeota archaeon]
MRRTAYNLMKSFLRDSQTRTRYEIYSEIAKQEKFLFISKTFKEFANQRKENANLLYQMLQTLKKEEIFENLTIEIKIPTIYGKTDENIESSIKEEDEEWQELCPSYVNVAETEGYKEIAKKLKQFSQIKKNQSQRLKMLLNLIREKEFSERRKITFWKCLSCGFEVAIDEIPNNFNCPTCGHNKSYFQKKILQLVYDELSDQKRELSGWICMECGYEVALEELPDDWKCVSCGRSKAYFKRKTFKPKDYVIKSSETEKAHWICLECGNEEEIEMPSGWKCPKCGFPKE